MKAVSTYFSHPTLFSQALTHRSYCNEHSGLKSNERLEFLGDAVLSIIISHRLYKLLPRQPEGELTARRSGLVQTTTLAAKSKSLGLDKLLLLSRGEEDSGGRSNPSLLANTFEAVLGALYLDKGLTVAWEYLLEIFPDDALVNQSFVRDPKSLLQEQAQAAGWGTPIYSTISAQGPDHAKKFTVAVSVNSKQVGVGLGNSKQRAETAAAMSAMVKLDHDQNKAESDWQKESY